MIFPRRIVFYKDSGPKTSPLSGIPLHDFLVAYFVFTRILSRKRVIECDENGWFFDSNSLEPWITYTHRCVGHREGPSATHIYIYKYIHIYLSTYIYICVYIYQFITHSGTIVKVTKIPLPWKKFITKAMTAYVQFITHSGTIVKVTKSPFPWKNFITKAMTDN